MAPSMESKGNSKKTSGKASVPSKGEKTKSEKSGDMQSNADGDSSKKRKGGSAAEAPIDSFQSTRETVESVVVAFVLAFLFRAFVAEAFVIPTGSMAPTLMGAHKDIFCEHCGEQYQASASNEFDPSTGAITRSKTFASLCSNCRGVNAYDFENNADHATFSGDRILVSKFDYVLTTPKRWDVFVFKYPLKARMNYIKRLIGLPGETLALSEGDVFIQDPKTQEFEIARKPPHKIQAMKQLVYNSDHRDPKLIDQGWPSRWQPLPGSTGASVEYTTERWSGTLDASGGNTQWLRYYHKFVPLAEREAMEDGASLTPVDAYASRLITDYLAYNTSYALSKADVMFEQSTLSTLQRLVPPPIRKKPGWNYSEEKTGGMKVYDAVKQQRVMYQSVSDTNDGIHWVGDLSGAYSVDVQSESGKLLLDLVEFGVHFQCTIDVGSGLAELRALDSQSESGKRSLPIFGGKEVSQGKTPVQGPGTYELEFANFDDQLVLWVNGRVIEFDAATAFDSESFRSGSSRRPYWSSTDPLDAAPLGIGAVDGLKASITSSQVYRDIYYIAVQKNSPFERSIGFNDYVDRLSVSTILPNPSERAGVFGLRSALEAVFASPESWGQTELFDLRGSREFTLDEKQYFPLGDNSAQSSDARASEWVGHRYVEEKYLLGKALLVFWPHTWNTPVPFTPNVKRMGFIR